MVVPVLVLPTAEFPGGLPPTIVLPVVVAADVTVNGAGFCSGCGGGGLTVDTTSAGDAASVSPSPAAADVSAESEGDAMSTGKPFGSKAGAGLAVAGCSVSAGDAAEAESSVVAGGGVATSKVAAATTAGDPSFAALLLLLCRCFCSGVATIIGCGAFVVFVVAATGIAAAAALPLPLPPPGAIPGERRVIGGAVPWRYGARSGGGGVGAGRLFCAFNHSRLAAAHPPPPVVGAVVAAAATAGAGTVVLEVLAVALC